jgi:transposase-like protein
VTRRQVDSLRLHKTANVLAALPKSAQPWVSTLVRTIFELPDPASVRAQHAHVTAALEAKLPAAAAHLDEAREDMPTPSRSVWEPCAGGAPGLLTPG